MLERALKDIHFNPDPKKSAKQQALEVRWADPRHTPGSTLCVSHGMQLLERLQNHHDYG